MSEMELNKGKIKEIEVPENLSFEQQVEFVKSKGFMIDAIEDQWIYSRDVHHFKGKWYDIKDIEKTDCPHEDIFEGSYNEDGSISILAQFYNGGCCFSEALDDILEKLEKQERPSTVTISKEEYERLQSSELKLECLEGAGVDNWCGYSDAMEMMEEYE